MEVKKGHSYAEEIGITLLSVLEFGFEEQVDWVLEVMISIHT